MRHVIFIAATILLIVAVFLSAPTTSEEQAPVEREYRLQETPSTDTITCCTFVVDGQEKSCAVLPGRSCDICASVCG